jgi:hypothetical protein
MTTKGVSESSTGLKYRVFECPKCGQIESNAVASDTVAEAKRFEAGHKRLLVLNASTSGFGIF